MSQPDASQPILAETSMSSALRQAPSLSAKGLTVVLLFMCAVPITTVLILHFNMPPVRPGTLKAEFQLIQVPPASYYGRDLSEPDNRLEFPQAALVVKNTGEQPWTHLNVRINNGLYQIYQHASPLQPGEERSFLLNRFVTRSGNLFDAGRTRPTSVEVYARLPDRSRGTYEGPLQ